MDEITIIVEVTNKKHSDNYKYLIDQSNGHSLIHRPIAIVQRDVQRSTKLRICLFLLCLCSKIVKFMFFVVPSITPEEHTGPLLYSTIMCEWVWITAVVKCILHQVLA